MSDLIDALKKAVEIVLPHHSPPPAKPKEPPLDQPTDPPGHILELDPARKHDWLPVDGQRWRPGAKLALPPDPPTPPIEHPDLERLLDEAAARQAAANAAK